MKNLILLFVLFLTACSTTVPVKHKFPDVPSALTEKCQTLKKIDGDQVSIVDLHKTVVENYTSYYECAVKVDVWNEWYKQQREIFESVYK